MSVTSLIRTVRLSSGLVLMLLRVPVGMAMGLVGVGGYALISGSGPALKLIGQTSMRTVTGSRCVRAWARSMLGGVPTSSTSRST